MALWNLSHAKECVSTDRTTPIQDLASQLLAAIRHYPLIYRNEMRHMIQLRVTCTKTESLKSLVACHRWAVLQMY